MIRTIKDLVHCVLGMPDIKNEVGELISPEISVRSADGKEFVINDFYLRGDDKAVMIIKEVLE